MLTYEDLRMDIKLKYTQEQCEQMIIAAEKLRYFVADFMDAIRKIVQALEPVYKDIMKLLEEVQQEELVEKKGCLNSKYPQYKSKIKIVMLYKKPIYYHIRDNC